MIAETTISTTTQQPKVLEQQLRMPKQMMQNADISQPVSDFVTFYNQSIDHIYGNNHYLFYSFRNAVKSCDDNATWFTNNIATNLSIFLINSQVQV